jgi:hypothetical protein
MQPMFTFRHPKNKEHLSVTMDSHFLINQQAQKRLQRQGSTAAAAPLPQQSALQKEGTRILEFLENQEDVCAAPDAYLPYLKARCPTIPGGFSSSEMIFL